MGNNICILPQLGLGEVCVRMLLAMVVGLVIGTEREYTNRPAGMRTHVLVALGACSVMITGELVFQKYLPLGAAPDPARLSAQVITGVGFLGAGTILREGTSVKGLTTAASLWAVACLGIAAGGGYYAVALLGMVFIFLTLTVMEVFQNHLLGVDRNLQYCTLEVDEPGEGLEALGSLAQKHRVALLEVSTSENQIRFRAEIGGIGSKRRRRRFFRALTAHPVFRRVQLRAEGEEQVKL